MAEYAKLLSIDGPDLFLCALQIQDTYSSGSVMFSISLCETLSRSYQFFMYTKLYYICIKLIYHFLNFSSILSRTTEDVFSF